VEQHYEKWNKLRITLQFGFKFHSKSVPKILCFMSSAKNKMQDSLPFKRMDCENSAEYWKTTMVDIKTSYGPRDDLEFSIENPIKRNYSYVTVMNYDSYEAIFNLSFYDQVTKEGLRYV
jgi:hypothetical protein